MKTLILGMAKGDGGRGNPLMPSLSGRASSADRLLAYSGMSREEFLDRFKRRNLFSHGKWKPKHAKAKGRKLRKKLRRKKIDGRVIVLGRANWQALGFPRGTKFFDHYSEYSDANGLVETKFVLVPHPSGRNLSYNDPTNVEKLRNVLRGNDELSSIKRIVLI